MYGYADATWAYDKSDRKSNSGRIMYFNGGTISWGCNKQNVVASSSCEAEFISIAEASKEVKWLRQLLEEMNEPIETPTTIYEDNQSCIELVRDSKFSYKTKHPNAQIMHIFLSKKDTNYAQLCRLEIYQACARTTAQLCLWLCTVVSRSKSHVLNGVDTTVHNRRHSCAVVRAHA